ncbi:hypothetical protein QE152_g36706 [Popillia japonica]|uniref:Uncharacterized protein n=1 Tax=Popillia japonica TaxID=7064 RepID=A0AAW1IC22_POPJA
MKRNKLASQMLVGVECNRNVNEKEKMLRLTKGSANGLALLLKEVFLSPMLQCKAEEFAHNIIDSTLRHRHY